MRTTGDWVLAGFGVMTLLLFAVFLWWFGPWHAALGFGLWALLSGPLLILAWRRTRSRWLLYLGSGLFPCGLVVGLTAGSVWSWGAWQAIATSAVAAGLPLAITSGWVRRLLRRSHGPEDRWTLPSAITFAASAGIMIGTLSWARAEAEGRDENWAYVPDFAACYEVEFGPWIPSVMLGHAAQGIVPARIRLDTTRGSNSFESNKPLIRPGWSDGEAYWAPTDAKRVELVWHNGFHGVGLSLHRRGSELRGRAVGHTDVGGFWPESRALVRARPIDCALVPADTVRDQRARERAQRRDR